MKLVLHFLFLLVFSTKLFAQEIPSTNKIIFLDSLWEETTEANYKYIRIVENYYTDQDAYTFKDYYKSKTLQMIGKSSNKDYIREEGQFVYYYENGKKKTSVNYSSGKKTGIEFNWYEDGNIKSELEYFENKKGEIEFMVNNYWNSHQEQKVVKGNGDYEYSNKDFTEEGKVKNGLHEGLWKGKNRKPAYTFTENYEDGKLLSGVSTDSLNVQHPYQVVIQPPVPKDGMNSFYKYISRTLKIPSAAKNTVFGKIYLTFIVDQKGNLVEGKIIKGLGYGLDEAALDVIAKAKKWIPGIKRGIPIRVLYSLPITIAKNPF